MQDSENQQFSNQQPQRTAVGAEQSRWRVRSRETFLNEHGLRAGWRFVLFFILTYLLVLPAFVALRPFRHTLASHLGDVVEFVLLLGVLATTYVMSRVERRSFFNYGLEDGRAFRHLLSGVATGFLSLTFMLLALRVAHHFDFGPQHMHGRALLEAALLNALLFTIVALFEETGFRGYPLHTLADGMGFWPAAVLISLLFAYVHVQNPGEAPMGIAAVFVFGIMLAFSLWRTGNLIWAIGFHFMWDYSETFIYGVPDSGFVSPQHLLSAKFSGPAWITGGTVGPEGSAFIFVVLGLVAVLIHFQYPTRQFRVTQPKSRNRNDRHETHEEVTPLSLGS